ncbi:MAG: MFS transporter, partial [Acutalibacteraceae bacterium]|nr:MFS transporter [Acutalibacteraceae bacterium]
MKKNYKSTVNACFAGYVVQAIVNNFVPLLFLTFNKSYGIELSKITALITVNFILQLIIDLLSAFFIDKIGYRAAAVAAHVFAAAGLVSLTVLPEILPSPFVGLLISVVLYAVGGGLLEVIVSPIVEACPTDNKEKMMSLLHSFYCWGSVAVVGISTLYFSIFTTAN